MQAFTSHTRTGRPALLIIAFVLGLTIFTAGPVGAAQNGISTAVLKDPPGSSPSDAPTISQYYVAPNGSPTGDGSLQNPWDLHTALNQPLVVRPGDTIWLRGGTYTGTFTSRLAGTQAAPIVVRQYPGERATLDKARVDTPSNILTVQGQYTWYWGFEIMNSHPDRVTEISGSDPSDLNRGEGIFTTAPGTRYINLIIHDARDAFGFWTAAVDAEIYGCIVYNNGWQGPDRGHGHGIYTQNLNGTKRILDNILFNQFAYGIKLYGETNGQVKGYYIEGNSTANNGSPSLAQDGRNIHIGGTLNPAERITVLNNYGYMRDSQPRSANARLGYTTSYDTVLAFRNNYLWGGGAVLQNKLWQQMTFEDNTLVGGDTYMLEAAPREVPTSTVTWNNNAYYRTTPVFRWNLANLNVDGWRNSTGFDTNSTYSNGTPPSAVFVRPNQYEPGRANITVFNHALEGTVSVDVSSVLAPGATYQVRNAHDYFAAPVVQGVYNGDPLILPMSGLSIAQPVGYSGTLPATGPQYNVFVLLSTASPPPSTPAPSTRTATRTPVAATATGTSIAATATNTSEPIVTPDPTGCTISFTDVPPGSTYYSYVQCLACRDIISGYPNGKFRPEYDVTRGQASKMVSSSAGFSDTPADQTYEDVPPDHTFYLFVERLSSRDLVTGYPCGSPGERCGPENRPYFRPGADASRGQVSKLVANAAGYNEPPVGQTFQDVPLEYTFYPQIERLASRGVVNGYPCGGPSEPCNSENRPYFRPGNAVTRGQGTKMVATTFFPECNP